MCAALLSWMYPDLSSKFYGLVETVGMARMLQGVHYPSDNDAGMLLSAAIWEDIKYKINAPHQYGGMGNYTLTTQEREKILWTINNFKGWEESKGMDTEIVGFDKPEKN